jgi:hypothetical protein
MTMKLRVTTCVLLLTLPMFVLNGCGEEGAGEKAGTAIDNAAQKVMDAVDPPGPLEKAGRAIDKAVQ